MAQQRFIDRHFQRSVLDAAWRSMRPELVVMHGRRRVGKTALLTRFAARRPVVYYAAAQQLERDQLADLGRALGRLSSGFRPGRPPRLALRDWHEFLSTVGEAARQRRVGVVLDEFPYLAQANPGLPSIIQRWWDAEGSNRNLVLVLAGSQQSMMQRLVSADGALYGRPTIQLHIEPFDYYWAGRFAARWSPEDRIRLYAVAGGMPDYLEEFDPTKSLRDEIHRLAYSPTGRLFREAPDLLRSEFSEPRTYESMLRAIAQGAVRPSEIANLAGLSGANRVAPYLERLTDLGLVQRRVLPSAAHDPRPRTSQYVLADPYLSFYYALVDPWRSAIEMGQGSAVMSELWPVAFDHHVSRTFEEACRQYISRLSAIGTIPPLTAIGTWWYAAGDVDVAGMHERELVIAGSAKWSNASFKPADVEELRRAVATIAPGSRPRLFLFARGGFDPNTARDVQTRQVRPADMYRANLAWEAKRT